MFICVRHSVLAVARSYNKHQIMPKWGIFNASLLHNEHGHPLFSVDTRSIETTFGMGENMQMCHSLRSKQIDMSTTDQLKSIFLNNAGTPKLILAESLRHMHV